MYEFILNNFEMSVFVGLSIIIIGVQEFKRYINK